MSYDDDRENLYLNLKIGENEDENEKEKEVEQEDDEDEEDEKENEQEDGQEDEQVEKYNDGTHNFSIKMIGSQSNEIRESYDGFILLFFWKILLIFHF